MNKDTKGNHLEPSGVSLSQDGQISNVIIEQHRKESADLSFPIIAVEQDGEIQCVLDGHHRLQKAVDENRTHVLAKVLVV